MKTVIRPLVIVGLLFVYRCNGDPECTKVNTSLYDVIFEAVSRPETFDQYVDQNQEVFNDNFFKCLEERRRRLDPEYETAKKECDAYLQAPDIWNKCKTDAYITWENGHIILNALEKVGKGTVQWSSTGLGQQVIQLKASDPESWNYMVESLSDYMNQTDYCEICED